MGQGVVKSQLGSVDRGRGDDGLEHEEAGEWQGPMGSWRERQARAD